MNINTDLKNLKEVFNLTKENLNIIANKENFCILSKTKNDIIIKKNIAGVIEEAGSLLLDKEIINNIQFKDADLNITNTTLKVNNRKFTFAEKETDLVVNDIGEKIATLTLEDYNNIIDIEYAIAQDEARPVLNNVYVGNEDIVALDGYRLAIRKNKVEFTVGNESFYIHLDLLKLMKKIKPNEKSIIEIYSNNIFSTLRIDDLYLTKEKENTTYINYKSLIPYDFSTVVQANKNDVLEVLKSYKKENRVLKLDIKKDKMLMQTSTEKFNLEDKIKVISNNDLLIAMNPNYLKEAINKYDDKIEIKFNNSVSPFVIEKENSFDMILPVRLNR